MNRLYDYIDKAMAVPTNKVKVIDRNHSSCVALAEGIIANSKKQEESSPCVTVQDLELQVKNLQNKISTLKNL